MESILGMVWMILSVRLEVGVSSESECRASAFSVSPEGTFVLLLVTDVSIASRKLVKKKATDL